MSSMLLLAPLAEEHAHGNPNVELLLVFFLLLVFWAVFRITGRKRKS